MFNSLLQVVEFSIRIKITIRITMNYSVLSLSSVVNPNPQKCIGSSAFDLQDSVS